MKDLLEELNKDFKLTIENYGTKVTIQKNRGDLTLKELEDVLRSACLAIGWSEASINEMFNGEA